MYLRNRITMKAELNQQNIDKAEELFLSNPNFKLTVLPRLKLLYAIKKELKSYNDLKWSFEFDHVNVNQNRVYIDYLPSANTELSLYYEIPLTQKFAIRSFLGSSSVHFLDVYNFLIENSYIKEKQFAIHAEYRKVPHFILNLKVKKYQVPVLNHYSDPELNLSLPIDELVLEEFITSFNLFNPIFKLIIDNFRQ
jgi:hypothetical protein